MVEGKRKSRTLRRVFVRTPGGRTVVHYRKRKPSKAKCGVCGAILKGVPRGRPYKMKNMPKTAIIAKTTTMIINWLPVIVTCAFMRKNINEMHLNLKK